MTPRLELKGVSKNFGDVQAVRSMDFALEPGEFLSLLGPSGCGKSTTLAMIAGFEDPSAGEICVDGERIDSLPAGQRQIGLVFQDYAVFSRLTVASNLSFGLEAQRVPRKERRHRIDAISDTLGLGQLMDKRGAALNMSEMQRVALARVLVTKPRLLLLDEPMSNLDAALRTTLRSELKILQKELEQTVLYVTHDQAEAMGMSDRIAVMHDGVVEQIGSPADIYGRPDTRFVTEFIGDPPINLVPCTLDKPDGGDVLQTVEHKMIEIAGTDVPAGAHTLGIRPHDVRLSAEANPGAVQSAIRFVEDLGMEHILYCSYGDDLITATMPPGFAKAGDTVWLSFEVAQMHIIRSDTDTVVPCEVRG